ncbi:hypothetical protein MKK63_26100 [Methylobacterium sp. J-088]|uniref:DUF6894 family protein n=1 Tax=Methylobacterium sp. J-088 TaxID=2836664 RepID=UPI001FB9F21F|nr:hypothetical protein [Methylobacterium sp. J-088]MCJ2066145.1 hypothetical protein [Methylobacterium sp. J-088]
MSRYFINMANHVTVMDEERVEVSDRNALRDLLRETLTLIIHDDGDQTGVNEFAAQAYDEDGQLVMSARASFSITNQ